MTEEVLVDDVYPTRVLLIEGLYFPSNDPKREKEKRYILDNHSHEQCVPGQQLLTQVKHEIESDDDYETHQDSPQSSHSSPAKWTKEELRMLFDLKEMNLPWSYILFTSLFMTVLLQSPSQTAHSKQFKICGPKNASAFMKSSLPRRLRLTALNTEYRI